MFPTLNKLLYYLNCLSIAFKSIFLKKKLRYVLNQKFLFLSKIIKGSQNINRKFIYNYLKCMPFSKIIFYIYIIKSNHNFYIVLYNIQNKYFI